MYTGQSHNVMRANNSLKNMVVSMFNYEQFTANTISVSPFTQKSVNLQTRSIIFYDTEYPITYSSGCYPTWV